MNESDLFNKDTMYWREINYSSPDAIAELELIEPLFIQGEAYETIICSLHAFEAHKVEYDLDNGGSFLKNEVKSWPFVRIIDLAFYNNQENPEQERQAKLLSVSHNNLRSITLKDEAGNVIVKKSKI